MTTTYVYTIAVTAPNAHAQEEIELLFRELANQPEIELRNIAIEKTNQKKQDFEACVDALSTAAPSGPVVIGMTETEVQGLKKKLMATSVVFVSPKGEEWVLWVRKEKSRWMRFACPRKNGQQKQVRSLPVEKGWLEKLINKGWEPLLPKISKDHPSNPPSREMRALMGHGYSPSA
jgi:hypothetical protein